jgi:LPS-assembly lipoprotein
MSWSRRTLLASGLAVLAGPLAGCGFRPLYGNASATPKSGNAPVDAQLALIKVDPVTSSRNPDPFAQGFEADYDARTGQILHNYLRDGFTPRGQSQVAYRLAVEITEKVDRTLTVKNDETTREDLGVSAAYELTDAKGQTLVKDTSRIITSYDVTNEPFNDISVRKDARRRAAEQLGELIKTRLSVFFTKGY